jgi:HAE1 family hydrophobic/amphiphilic exporter-1
VVNNGIVLVDHVEGLQRAGRSLEEAVLEGCTDRLRPILMTAGTTILGLLPLSFASGAHVAGAEYYPMARAISGGLASSTVLTLLAMPTCYLLAVRWREGLAGRPARRGAAPEPAVPGGKPSLA